MWLQYLFRFRSLRNSLAPLLKRLGRGISTELQRSKCDKLKQSKVISNIPGPADVHPFGQTGGTPVVDAQEVLVLSVLGTVVLLPSAKSKKSLNHHGQFFWLSKILSKAQSLTPKFIDQARRKFKIR